MNEKLRGVVNAAPYNEPPTKPLSPGVYAALAAALFAALVLCICVGSVYIPPDEVFAAFFGSASPTNTRIILHIRLPRVLCAALIGAALSLGGAAMQGLLKNPLADGTTVGVSAGASVGAVLAIWLTGGAIAVWPFAAAGAFSSLTFILWLANRIDRTLSGSTIILMGVIFSMFANAVISLIIALSGDRVRPIMFWTLGSVNGATLKHAGALALAFCLFGAVLLRLWQELNAFAIGEDNARGIGVNVKRTQLVILVCVSALIGVCVSTAGTIAFVGLVVPHMTRFLAGPSHRKLLPASAFAGAGFLMLADLLSRTALSPRELPVGVVTSLLGAALFLYIFAKKGKNHA